MGSKIERNCCHCGELFEPDCRNRRRQLSCTSDECKRAMKAERQRRWLNKPENQDYFRGADHVERVRAWRKENPGYWKRKRLNPRAPLQDALTSQVADDRSALQDVLHNQHAVLIGLISHISGTTLQDDIDYTLSNLVRLGHDILRSKEIRQYGSQGSTQPGPSPPYPETV